ncbi:hypothetical protein GKE82_11425 [Conexibacter sp. W3-3-2]|uniref:phospholipase D family protein n=1 Tax=Conexibacter sp. W3-3-2 TaxID=2675227 RepID=UPI0012B7F5F0|nr:phospholipase D family protein [Conexibacter sp. W3-3-2]MTD44885.1 hypothetical protein [Conexibacter sp. W3-3-2]
MMLAPTDRRLLLDTLAPPAGYRLDHAIGTTYTLDLLALLRVPLAATALPWSADSGGPVENPFALLTALRRNAGRISLFCHAGATKVPAKHVPLLAFLENSIHPVTPPRPGGVFHPKCWLLRFTAELPDAPVRYRLLVLSRNLTFDKSWDVALCLDGELLDRQRRGNPNRPLAEFFAALPGMASAAGHPLEPRAIDRVEQMTSEVRRVHWTLPEAFDDLAFHPIGHDGKPNWPIENLHRLMVISPFVGAPFLSRIAAEVRADLTLVARYDELVRLEADALDALDQVDAFDDAATLLDIEDESGEKSDLAEQLETELSGLHAKVFVGERWKHAAVYIGSANATEAAFERNVEFLVELDGWRTRHGTKAVRGQLEDANLLRRFKQTETPQPEDPSEALQRKLEHAAHKLATGALRATATAVDDRRWQLALHASGHAGTEGVRIEARPLSDPGFRPVDLAADPAAAFRPTSLASITPFFALRLTGRTDTGVERHLDVTARLQLDGAPDGRAEAVTAEILSDTDRLLRFILLLLADDGDSDRMLGELEALLTEKHAGSSAGNVRGALGLPLLEPMLRALHRSPEKLDEIDRLLADMRTAGASTEALLPKELEEFWETINEVRRART